MVREFYGTAPVKRDGYWEARIECGGGDYVAAAIYGSTLKQTAARVAACLRGLNAAPSDKEGGE